MSKTSAQILREHMDAINTTTAPVSEAISGDQFDFVWTIANPRFNAADLQDEETPEDIEVGVNYSISGRYYAATMHSPAEYPELEITDVVDLATGQDITGQVAHSDMVSLESEAWEHAEERKRQSEEDAAEARFSDPGFY